MKRLVIAMMIGVVVLSYTGCGESEVKNRILEDKEESIAKYDTLVKCDAYVADRSACKDHRLLFTVTIKSVDGSCAFVIIDYTGDFYFDTLDNTDDDIFEVTALVDKRMGGVDYFVINDRVYIDYHNSIGTISEESDLSIYGSKYYDLTETDSAESIESR